MDQEHALKAQKHASQKADGAKPLQVKETSLKRKHEDEPEPEKDPKLQEYLGVMQPASKSRTWANEDLNQVRSGQQDVVVKDTTQGGSQAQVGSKEDYLEVPKERKKARKDAEQFRPEPIEIAPVETAPEDIQPGSEIEVLQPSKESEVPPATDDDWLRSRTSRLLGLAGSEDAMAPNDRSEADEVEKGKASGKSEARSRSESIDAAIQTEADAVHSLDVKANPASSIADDAARATNRLFVRNLPYTATEDDLRQHFERLDHGIIAEVRSLFHISIQES